MNAEKIVTGGCVTARKAVFVSVTDALAGLVPDIMPTTPLDDVARGFWHVNDITVKQCELLVAVDKSIIRGIWEIDMDFGWHPMSKAAIPTRNISMMVVDPSRKYCRVTGAILPEFYGKELSSVWGGMRMYGPVRYNF